MWKNAEFDQLPDELAVALTKCESNVTVLRTSEHHNTQKREDLDQMRNNVDILVTSETERVTLAASVATLEDDSKAKTAKLKQLLAQQTKHTAKAQTDLSRDSRRWRESLM